MKAKVEVNTEMCEPLVIEPGCFCWLGSNLSCERQGNLFTERVATTTKHFSLVSAAKFLSSKPLFSVKVKNTLLLNWSTPPLGGWLFWDSQGPSQVPLRLPPAAPAYWGHLVLRGHVSLLAPGLWSNVQDATGTWAPASVSAMRSGYNFQICFLILICGSAPGQEQWRERWEKKQTTTTPQTKHTHKTNRNEVDVQRLGRCSHWAKGCFPQRRILLVLKALCKARSSRHLHKANKLALLSSRTYPGA